MKSWGSILLFLLLPNWSFAAAPHDNTQWLINQFETVGVLDTINAGTVRGVLQCACHELAVQGKAPRACDGIVITREEPAFTHELIDYISKQKVQETYSGCQEVLNLFVFNKTKLFYPKMRVAMSLMRPQIDVDDRVARGVPNLNTAGYFISTQPWHDGVNSVFNHTMEVAQVPVLSADEIQSNLKIYNEEVQTLCLEYFGDPAHAKNIAAHDICDFSVYEKSSSQLPASYFIWLKSKLQSFRDKYRKIYLKEANSNPMLLLIDRPDPDLEKVAGALRQIDTNAQERLLKSRQSAKDIRTMLQRYGESSIQLNDYVNDNLLEYAGFENAFIYTRIPLQGLGWSDLEIAQAQVAVNAKYERQRMERAGLQVAGFGAIIALCSYVPGRVAMVGISLFLKSTCFMGLGVPFNTYVFADTINDYNEALKDFFVAIEPHKTLRLLESLSGETNSILFAGAFLPIGASPKVVVQVSKKIMQWVEELKPAEGLSPPRIPLSNY